MPHAFKGNQLTLGNQLGHLRPQHCIVAQLRFHLRRRDITADGCGVLVTDQQQGGHLQVLELVVHRLGEDHVVDQRRVPRHRFMPRPLVQAHQHLHPALVLRLPAPGVVGLALILAHAFGIQLELARIPLVHRAVGHAQGFPVFQADGVDHRQALHLLRVHQRIAGGEHAAGGVAEHDALLHPQLFEQSMGVARQLLEAVLVMRRLAGAAEADLVGGDDTVASLAQGIDGGFPGGGAEVLAMHQHHAVAVGLALGGHVHVAHLQGLALGLEVEMLERMRVAEALQLGAIGGRFGGDGRTAGEAGQGQGGCAQHGGTPCRAM